MSSDLHFRQIAHNLKWTAKATYPSRTGQWQVTLSFNYMSMVTRRHELGSALGWGSTFNLAMRDALTNARAKLRSVGQDPTTKRKPKLKHSFAAREVASA